MARIPTPRPSEHLVLVDRARSWASRIGRALADPPLVPGHRDLGSGHAGIALFLAYLAEVTDDSRLQATAEAHLVQAADALADLEPFLFSGALGVAWVVEHLGGGEALTGSLDRYLDTLLTSGRFDGRWELMYGLAGVGVYLLERPDGPARTQALAQVVTILDAVAAVDDRGVHWSARVDPGQPDRGCNLGLAHGACGVIVLLARLLAETTIAPATVRRLLEGSVCALQACRLSGRSRSSYPAFAERREASRLGWCYGDLGVAVALLAAGRALGAPAHVAEARAVAIHAASRDRASAGVKDAGLCHGAVGIAHVFSRLHDQLGDDALADAATSWLCHALEMRAPDAGIGEVRAWSAPGNAWLDERGFLVGAAGVGLGLLAVTGAIDPAWDRVLLLHPVETRNRGLPF